jgi:hypothetical protein
MARGTEPAQASVLTEKEQPMGNRYRLLGWLVLVPALGLTGCGNDGSAGDDAGTGDATTGDASTTGPVVLAVTPEDGALGVLEGASIVIQFDRAMDTASVHAAFSSPDFDLAETGVTWNAAGDTLTISGSGILEYAEGASPEAVTAHGYAFDIDTTATDADGNPLEEALSVTFHTARLILAAPGLVEDHTGTVGSDVSADAAALSAGDDADDETFHGVITFDLSEVAEAPIAIEQATLSMRQANKEGDPFEVLGTCYFEHVAFGELDALTYQYPTLRVIDTLDPADVVYTLDVAEDVDNDLGMRSERGDRSQYRVRFSTLTNADGEPDLLHLIADSPSLDLRYLIE